MVQGLEFGMFRGIIIGDHIGASIGVHSLLPNKQGGTLKPLQSFHLI